MNILKHMEAVFIATVVLAVSGSHMVDMLPQAHAKSAPTAYASNNVPVVVVKAKRMTAAEKQQSLQEERSAATGQPASRI